MSLRPTRSPVAGDVIPSPNIWHHTDVYEQENLAVDPGGVIETAMAQRHDWAGQHVVDIGCGTGFHLPRFGATAAHVVGVEPHPPLVTAARRRLAAIDDPTQRQRLQVVAGSASRLPVPGASIDVAHARWAYFFGPGCEPGLAELERVMRRGGTAFVIDNDATRSTFGGWFRRGLPRYDPVAVQRFWDRQGWHATSLDIGWSMPDRATFEAVVGIEFAPELAADILASHPGTEVDYAVALRWRTY